MAAAVVAAAAAGTVAVGAGTAVAVAVAVVVVGMVEAVAGTAGRPPNCWAPNALFSNDFYQGAFTAAAVKFAVENLFPRAEIEFPFCDSDNDFPPHDLAFQMGVSIVFAGEIMSVMGGGRVRCELFQPGLVIRQQAVLR